MQPPSPAALSPGKRSAVALGIAVETSQHCAEVRAQRSEPKSERAALIDNPVTPAEVRVVVQRHRVTGTRLLIRGYRLASSTMTGTWSLAPLPLRSSRSKEAPFTLALSRGEPSTKSIRIPRRFGKLSCL